MLSNTTMRPVAFRLLATACGTASVPAASATPEVLAAREAAFSAACAECHGPRATGTDQGPPLVDDIYRSSHHALGSDKFVHRPSGVIPPAGGLIVIDRKEVSQRQNVGSG